MGPLCSGGPCIGVDMASRCSAGASLQGHGAHLRALKELPTHTQVGPEPAELALPLSLICLDLILGRLVNCMGAKFVFMSGIIPVMKFLGKCLVTHMIWLPVASRQGSPARAPQSRLL